MTEKDKDFLEGLAISAACHVLPARKVFREPIAYSYNGVILPKLPEWDRERYPYAVIIKQGLGEPFFYWLTVSSVAFIHGNPQSTWGKNVLWGAEDGIKKLFRYGTDDDTWFLYSDGQFSAYIDDPSLEESSSADTVNIGAWGNVLWCNQTITYVDNTISCSASEPIPVYE